MKTTGKNFFAHLIENHEAITEAVLHQQEMIAQHDFPPAISLEDSGSLIYFFIMVKSASFFFMISRKSCLLAKIMKLSLRNGTVGDVK